MPTDTVVARLLKHEISYQTCENLNFIIVLIKIVFITLSSIGYRISDVDI